jgi:hypothetical protein
VRAWRLASGRAAAGIETHCIDEMPDVLAPRTCRPGTAEAESSAGSSHSSVTVPSPLSPPSLGPTGSSSTVSVPAAPRDPFERRGLTKRREAPAAVPRSSRPQLT